MGGCGRADGRGDPPSGVSMGTDEPMGGNPEAGGGRFCEAIGGSGALCTGAVGAGWSGGGRDGRAACGRGPPPKSVNRLLPWHPARSIAATAKPVTRSITPMP
jgi:hypothetical protein